MQITIEIPDWLKSKSALEFIVWPLAGWIARTAYYRGKAAMNRIVTDNNNRTRDEAVNSISALLDKKFTEHEANAFGRITALERSVQDIARIIKDIQSERSNRLE